MKTNVQRLEMGAAIGQTGTVKRVEGRTIVVSIGTSEINARRAVGCLVQPEVGDLVLVAIPERATCYVLSVLERTEGAAARMVADGDLEVSLPRGRFRIAAQNGVDVTSGERVAVTSAGVDVNTVDANVAVDRLSFLGRFVQFDVEQMKMFAVSVESVLDRWIQRAKRSYRIIAETDQLRAAHIDHKATESLHLRARTTMLTAEDLVKLDAEQIHLG